MEWAKESWALISSWATAYSAERDRRALQQAALEREKLKLEVARLKNDPTIVSDRRAIYDRLRRMVGEITRDAKVSIKQIYDLHEVIHDAEFRFTGDVVDSVKGFLHAAVELQVAGARLEDGPKSMTKEQWERQVQADHDALSKVAAFEQDMVGIFRPHLLL